MANVTTVQATDQAGPGPDVRPRALFVDDEPSVVSALLRQVRSVLRADSATDPLTACVMVEAAVAGQDPYAVVVSDMRMPGMDGAALLKQCRVASPDSTRVLLTGHSDIEHAVAAVNEGNIFRFLSKPCPAAVLRGALADAVEQHRLVTGQRVLLEETLRGAVEALTETLAMARPDAFARASRLRRLARAVAEELDLPDVWQLEMAAQLGEIGAVTLPEEALVALARGSYTDPRIASMLDLLPALADDVLRKIPRLEPVRELLRAQNPVDTAADDRQRVRSTPASALQAVREFDALTSRGYLPPAAVELLRGRLHHPQEVLDALARVAGREPSGHREVDAADLREGLVLAADLRTANGTPVAHRGQLLTAALITLIRNCSQMPGLMGRPLVLVEPPSTLSPIRPMHRE